MKNVEVVCAVIKNEEGKYYCCRRGPGRMLEGFFEFPGGKIEPHETKEEALVREIKEELKTVIKPVKFITTVEHTYDDMPPYKGFHIIMHAYLCELIHGHLQITEHTEGVWKTPQEMLQMGFAPADVPIVEILKEIV